MLKILQFVIKMCSNICVVFKGKVHLKIKLIPYFTHPQAILGVHILFSFSLTQSEFLKNILALPSFIMGMNGTLFSEAQKFASIQKCCIWLQVVCCSDGFL